MGVVIFDFTDRGKSGSDGGVMTYLTDRAESGSDGGCDN